MAPLGPLPWSMDPQLFLHTQGRNIVQIWKCKKTNNLSQPMKREDFDYVGNVEKDKHQELVYMYIWDETDYKRLIKYISERRLLVNGQGVLIAEQHKFLKDGKIDVKESPIYIRSLHVLSLKTFINGFGERTVPFRTIQYLDDTNDASATRPVIVPVLIEPSSKELKFEVDLKKVKDAKEALKKEVHDLKDKIKTLEAQVKKLNEDLETQKKKIEALEQEIDQVKRETKSKVVELEGKKATLEARVKNLTAEIETERKREETARQELNQVNNAKQALNGKIIEKRNEIDRLR